MDRTNDIFRYAPPESNKAPLWGPERIDGKDGLGHDGCLALLDPHNFDTFQRPLGDRTTLTLHRTGHHIHTVQPEKSVFNIDYLRIPFLTIGPYFDKTDPVVYNLNPSIDHPGATCRRIEAFSPFTVKLMSPDKFFWGMKGGVVLHALKRPCLITGNGRILIGNHTEEIAADAS